jgi:hypothetical protein
MRFLVSATALRQMAGATRRAKSIAHKKPRMKKRPLSSTDTSFLRHQEEMQFMPVVPKHKEAGTTCHKAPVFPTSFMHL